MLIQVIIKVSYGQLTGLFGRSIIINYYYYIYYIISISILTIMIPVLLTPLGKAVLFDVLF